ncbi:hypothetical protein FKM82_009158 [Ascaphus truei]
MSGVGRGPLPRCLCRRGAGGRSCTTVTRRPGSLLSTFAVGEPSPVPAIRISQSAVTFLRGVRGAVRSPAHGTELLRVVSACGTGTLSSSGGPGCLGHSPGVIVACGGAVGGGEGGDGSGSASCMRGGLHALSGVCGLSCSCEHSCGSWAALSVGVMDSSEVSLCRVSGTGVAVSGMAGLSIKSALSLGRPPRSLSLIRTPVRSPGVRVGGGGRLLRLLLLSSSTPHLSSCFPSSFARNKSFRAASTCS